MICQHYFQIANRAYLALVYSLGVVAIGSTMVTFAMETTSTFSTIFFKNNC